MERRLSQRPSGVVENSHPRALGVIDLDSIRAAAQRIDPYIVRTPTLRFEGRGTAELFLKPENLQPVGSFKIRGAFNRMLQLPDDCPGVVTHSSGNHARAVAYAARILGTSATIVMPSNAPAVKRGTVEAEGATVITVGPDSEERRERALSIEEEEGLAPVPPYDHPEVMAGQGTAALELLHDAGPMDHFYCPVSGGGLIAGCATALSALGNTEIVGVEPESGDDTRRSLAASERVAVPPPQTIADGLSVRIPGERTWPIVKALVSRIETVTDQELKEAMAFALRQLRIVLEPSGAAALAVALREGEDRSGVLLSGGNVDPGLLTEVSRIDEP